ncbi:MAG: hypothetical protein WAR37_00935 [Candidatus Microsaccharimonas sp.]
MSTTMVFNPTCTQVTWDDDRFLSEVKDFCDLVWPGNKFELSLELIIGQKWDYFYTNRKFDFSRRLMKAPLPPLDYDKLASCTLGGQMTDDDTLVALVLRAKRMMIIVQIFHRQKYGKVPMTDAHYAEHVKHFNALSSREAQTIW